MSKMSDIKEFVKRGQAAQAAINKMGYNEPALEIKHITSGVSNEQEAQKEQQNQVAGQS